MITNRVAYRMNHSQLIDQYIVYVRLCMENKVICNGGVGIYQKFFGE